MSAGKKKLRTAGDVISRLQWSEEVDPALVLMGYDDRINGPMEKSIADYKSIDDGGDIPQHRIQYFRRTAPEGERMNMNQIILWDREGRVDRLFGSGLGSEVPASEDTIKLAFYAIENMKRIAEEQEIRRQEKAKQRARRQRKVQAKIRAESGACNDQAVALMAQEAPPATTDRFQWSTATWFGYSETEAEWRSGPVRKAPNSKNGESQGLRVVTWNVLFDKHEAETSLFEGDNAIDRWRSLIRQLGVADADLIALQEVTPRFIGLLCESTWVRRKYSVSASVEDTSSIEPYGNILLWKRRSLRPVSIDLGLHVLADGPRKRSVVACLQSTQDPNTILSCACVHLPCDATAHGENSDRLSRATARRRELNNIVGKLQTLEDQLGGTSTKSVVPLLLGDFNSDEKNSELEDGGFLSSMSNKTNLDGVFTDVWPLIADGRSGCTYNPDENRRASFSVKGPRRIDRICVGKGRAEMMPRFRPLAGTLIGLPIEGESPPSDHYGLSVLFEIKESPKHPSCTRPLLDHNAWASTVLPTTDVLLALTLQNDSLVDAASSLPIPHITLLHGFAELMCDESRNHAMQAVEAAVQQTVASVRDCAVPFSRESLTVFEHRSSATLVGVPDGPCRWLKALYQALRTEFRFCDEQESRFLEGWSPHVSLGRFGSGGEARQAANRMVSDGSWFNGRSYVPAQAVVIYQRDSEDRKFYAAATFPLERKPQNVQNSKPREFLVDAGASLSSYFSKQSAPYMSDIERVCSATLAAMSNGSLEAKLKRYGSCNLGASLPFISDIDAVVELSPKQGERAHQPVSQSGFLRGVGERLKSIHPNAKVRTRIAGTNGVALWFLTLKINPRAPPVDLMACQCTSGGAPVDAIAKAAIDSIEDGRLVVEELGKTPQGSSSVIEAFEGALRLCKLWAYRRQIYGAALGFLGGGGWALLIAKFMTKGLRSGDLRLEETVENGLDIKAAAINILSYCFKEMELSWNQGVIALSETQTSTETRDIALARGTISVVAPVSGGDFARNTTRSTVESIANEIQRANAIMSGGSADFFLPMTQAEFLTQGSSILFLEIDVGKVAGLQGGPCLPEAKSWASRQILQTLVSLESELGDATLIRPFSRPVRIKGKLVYLVRVEEAAGDLNGFIRSRRGHLRLDASSFFGQGDEEGAIVEHKCLTASRFRQVFGS